MTSKPPCAHCRKRVASKPCGLCYRCHGDLAIRHATPLGGRFYADRCDREPTEEEVERTIAEQMRRLPAWWNDDFKTPATSAER